VIDSIFGLFRNSYGFDLASHKSNGLLYDTFLVFFLVFGAWQSLVIIYFHCMKISRMNILLNYYFCVLLKKEIHMHSEQHESEYDCLLLHILYSEGKTTFPLPLIVFFILLHCSDNPQNMWEALRR